MNRAFTETFARMLGHYVEQPDARVIVGVAARENGACRMHWTAVEDFEAE